MDKLGQSFPRKKPLTMSNSDQKLTQEIRRLTTWLQDAPDLTAARLGYLLRQQGVDLRTSLCVKVFPSMADPTSGVIMTSQKQVFQFAYNRAGMTETLSVIDEWINITAKVGNHPWRDEILCGLAMLS